MAERIYATRTGEDALEPMAEARFSVEDDLQALIAKHPELLDGQQIRPGDPRRWVLVTREKSIAETADAGARWALDHLIVDQDAVPTLVEVKLGHNREVRRTVVGQMLEYAAHAAQSWTPDGLRETFERTCSEHGLDPDEELQGLLQDGDPDADCFWRQAVTNLDASRLRLLFVADDILESLQRVVEFLNAQMPRIEVLAVEIKRFQGASMQTLVPRVIGKPNSLLTSGPSRRKLTRESFLAELPNDRAHTVAVRLLEVAQQSGAKLRYGSSSVSVLMPCALARPTSAGWETTERRSRADSWEPGAKHPVTVAWLVLPGKTAWNRIRNVAFGSIVGDESDRALLEILARWADQFSADDFAERAGTKSWVVDWSDAALHLDLLADRLARILSELKEL